MKPGNKAVKEGLGRLLETYAREQGCEPQSALRDLLTDLRHLSDEMGMDFPKASDGSYDSYLEEISEDND